MTLGQLTPAEAAYLLCNPPQFRGCVICEGGLPPAFLLERAISEPEETWRMPRLFCDDDRLEIVGSAIFKTSPKNRRIEIGYGVAPSRFHRGYATTGVGLMVSAAFASGLVDEVVAETLLTNLASRRVLEKTGFTICDYGLSPDGPVNRWSRRKSERDSRATRP